MNQIERRMSNARINDLPPVSSIDSESWKSKPDFHRPRSRSIIKEFSLTTSTHGIPGIARSQSKHNCIFWSATMIVFTSVMLYFVITSISAYFGYPLQTLVSFDNKWPQAFPAVTICNYSPLRYDRLIGPFLNYTNTLNLTNSNTISSVEAQYINQYLQYKLNQNESLDEFFYPLSSMLIKCTYNEDNCSAADFVQFLSSVYGLCYTFNSQSNSINNGTLHYNNENGYSGLLELRLYVHSHQYVPYYFDGVGLVIMVHDNTQLPLVDRVGIQLAPGKQHKLGYYKKTNSFLPSPYTTCRDKVTAGMQAVFNQFSGANYAYGEEICFTIALQTYTYQKCGCVNPSEWAIRYLVLPGTTNIIYVSLCNTSSNCYSDAAAIFQSDSSISSAYSSDCGLECFSNEFPLKLSSVSAPPEWLMPDIKQFVESSSITLPVNWSTTWPSEVQANYIGINVVCESTRVESYTQQATLGAVDVLSNVGGQTGLWIGISFLSLMEVAEMLYRLIRYRCYLIREKIRKKTAKKTQTMRGSLYKSRY